MSEGAVIEVELLSGRYHAHVWGEAQFGMAGPEWPPSPWRLLRALASAWFSAEPPLCTASERDALLEALGRSGAPEIWLPKASFHELRYYQPIRLGGSDRVLHHDFFAVPEGGRFWFRFAETLSPDQRALLRALCERLRYFGRSESRAQVRPVDLREPPKGACKVLPHGDFVGSTPVTLRRVLCPSAEFRASDLWALSGNGGTASGHPVHFVDALLKAKRPLPPGARWAEYAVPSDSMVHEIRVRPAVRPVQPDVDVAEVRFRLNRRVPIRISDLIPVARAFRDAAVEAHFARTGQMSKALSGREADGSIGRGHRHVYYLPRLGPSGRTIEELLVRIPAGRLARAELDALLDVSRISLDKGRYPITAIAEEIVAAADSEQRACRWRSLTPFVPPLRHRRGRQTTSVEEQALACIERFCGRRPIEIRRVAGPGAVGGISPLLAHEYASGGLVHEGRHWRFARRLGFWLEIVFDEPISLAAPIGADSHFGAGQFGPCNG